MDVLSRSTIPSSMCVIDPKLENYKMSRKILKERGYEVHLFNIDDPVHSMGFNPLQLIIDAFKRGDTSEAEMLANTFSYSVFNASASKSSGSNEDFFMKTACSLSNGMILALIDDCLKEDGYVNKKRSEAYAKLRSMYDSLDAGDQEKAAENFDSFRTAYYKELEEKKKVDREYPGEFPVDRIAVYNKDADAVQYHDFLLECARKRIAIPPSYVYREKHQFEDCINMYSLVALFTKLATTYTNPNAPDETMLDIYFSSRPASDRARLKYTASQVAGDRTKGSIFATMLADFTIFTFEDIGRMMSKSTMDLRSIGYGTKPKALFIGIPDYDSSKNFLASVLINQLYFILAKEATRAKSGKTDIPVKFILDEFGNIPAISDFDHMVTVCLGRNMSFDIYIQAISQLTNLYGDNAQTIQGNCGNQIFILTNDYKTAEDYSKSLGNRTRIDTQRSGNKFSDSKSFTESTSEQPLMNPNQLMGLLPGECVINRSMKRDDLSGGMVKPYPIYNSASLGNDLPYAYKYLTEYFPNAGDVSLTEANSEDLTGVNLRAITFDPYLTLERFAEEARDGSRARMQAGQQGAPKDNIGDHDETEGNGSEDGEPDESYDGFTGEGFDGQGSTYIPIGDAVIAFLESCNIDATDYNLTPLTNASVVKDMAASGAIKLEPDQRDTLNQLLNQQIETAEMRKDE